VLFTIDSYKIINFIRFDECDRTNYFGFFQYFVWSVSLIRIVLILIFLNLFSRRIQTIIDYKEKVAENEDYDWEPLDEEITHDVVLYLMTDDVFIKFSNNTEHNFWNKLSFSSEKTGRTCIIDIDKKMVELKKHRQIKIIDLIKKIKELKSINKIKTSVEVLSMNKSEYHVRISII